MTMADDIVSKRIFVGGLGIDVTEKDLSEKFCRFGKISGLDLKQRKDDKGAVEKCFAHLNIECKEADLKKCFATFQNAKWKGSTLKLQYAKECFLNRLNKERKEEGIAAEELKLKIAADEMKLKESQTPVAKTYNGKAVPGTQIQGKPDWIVGKYGRVLPVMKLKKSHTAKILRHDPSKLCHTAKIFKDKDNSLDTTCQSLSWELDVEDSDITRKIKGDFDSTSSKKRKKSLSMTETVGNKKIVLENITSSKHYLELKKTLPKEDEIQVVSINHEHKAPITPKHKLSNRFDSDSDTDNDSFSEPNKKSQDMKDRSSREKTIKKVKKDRNNKDSLPSKKKNRLV